MYFFNLEVYMKTYFLYCFIKKWFHILVYHFKIFEQKALHETTFGQLGIAKLRPKNEIIDVIMKSKETNEFWIKDFL